MSDNSIEKNNRRITDEFDDALDDLFIDDDFFGQEEDFAEDAEAAGNPAGAAGSLAEAVSGLVEAAGSPAEAVSGLAGAAGSPAEAVSGLAGNAGNPAEAALDQEEERQSLSSHHRHHHHRHSHHGSGSHGGGSRHHSSSYHGHRHHSSGGHSSRNSQPEVLSEEDAATAAAVEAAIGAAESSKKPEDERVRRIPLAAHHRSHRMDYADESRRRHHHHSGHRHRHHKQVTYVSQYRGNIELKGESQKIDTGELSQFREAQEKIYEEYYSGRAASENGGASENRVTSENRAASDNGSVSGSRTAGKENMSSSWEEPRRESVSASVSSQPADGSREIDQGSMPRLGSTIVAARTVKPKSTRKASSVESAGARYRRKARSRITPFKAVAGILIVLAVLMLGVVATLLVMRQRGQASMIPDPKDVKLSVPDGVEGEDDGKTITYKGQKYRWNDKITTVLFMGTDRTVVQQKEGWTSATRNGQSDSLVLGVIDNREKKISFVNINRDTMVPVTQYTDDGKAAGEKEMQICLAYAYGRDNRESCRHAVDAVSKYLFGIPIEAYAAISYDAVAVLNDAVGGVKLTVKEDLSSADPILTNGASVTLYGRQAETYVRYRNHDIVDTNEKRMDRQKQFLSAFAHQVLQATKQDLFTPLNLYSKAEPYMTTNITASQLTYLSSNALRYGVGESAIRSVPGESVDGADGSVEYHSDRTALYELMLDTFYYKVK